MCTHSSIAKLAILCLTILSVHCGHSYYPKGATVSFKMKHVVCPNGKPFQDLRDRINHSLQMFAEEKGDFRVLVCNEDDTICHSSTDFAIVVSIDSILLVNATKYEAELKANEKKLERKIEILETLGAIAAAGQISSISNAGIPIRIGKDFHDAAIEKEIRKNCMKPRLYVQIKHYDSVGKKFLWRRDGYVEAASYGTIYPDEQLKRLLSILETELRDNLPYFKI